jgi:hypothetical protein
MLTKKKCFNDLAIAMSNVINNLSRFNLSETITGQTLLTSLTETRGLKKKRV